jgi:hypothetical protein
VSFLVDTNVISELRKGRRCDPRVSTWFDGVPDSELFLSVLTIGELRRGIDGIKRRDARQAAALERWFRKLLQQHADRILSVDRAVAEEWGRLSVPDPLPVVDGLLAATANVHGSVLVTRNTTHLDRVTSCLNPFTGRSSGPGGRTTR